MNEFLFGKSDWKSIRIIFMVVLGFIALLWFIPVTSHDSHHTPLGRSSAQVRSLAQGTMVFAFDNGEYFPAADQWPRELIERGIIEQELLISPAETEDSVSYFFVPSELKMFEGDLEKRILIYEDPTHFEEGVVVGFVDCHTEVIPHVQFERMLAEQLSSQSADP